MLTRGVILGTLAPLSIAIAVPLAAAIAQQAPALDAEGQEAIEAVVKGSGKIAESVGRRVGELQQN